MNQLAEVKGAFELGDFIDIPDTKLSEAEYRTWICEAEKTICSNFDTVDRHTGISSGYTLEHAITPGIYTRALTMPKDTLNFSKIHIETHPFALLKGKISVFDGEKVVLLEAPYKGVTMAGTKRVAYVHEEVVWITFHPVSTDELEKLDENGVITCDTFEEFDQLRLSGGVL